MANDPQSAAIPLDDLARAARRQEEQAREIERLKDCLHEAHQNFEQRTRERDRLTADNAQVCDALRKVVELIRRIFGPKYDHAMKTALDCLKGAHPGEAILQAHAIEIKALTVVIAEEKERADSNFASCERIKAKYSDCFNREKALRDALGDRGHAACLNCAGNGFTRQLQGDLLRRVECPRRKELLG